MVYKGKIPRDFIDRLLEQADLVEVINQRVPLKKAGATFKACCPFHNEKTPSFNVNPIKQYFHCFGCGAHGDALGFLMDYEGLEFIEAVEQLAAQVGLTVPYEKFSPQQAKKHEKAKSLYDLMGLAASFYRRQLRDHQASKLAKEYLKSRGLTPEVAKDYRIGFAPPGWNSVGVGVAQASEQQLVELGLLVARDDGKTYDRFRNRLMFPIRDGRGRVVGFGGRVLAEEDNPKYLNSPETPIFHKSQILYGLYELRQARENFSQIFVVEGYMDVIALAQFGIKNSVATLGTATAEDHLHLLFRQVPEVVFCFDGDSAGLKAAWRALETAIPLIERERSVKFLFLPEGEDPDSLVRNETAEGFYRRAKDALTLSQFWLQGLQNRISDPINTHEGRQQLVALAQPYILTARGLYQYLLVEAVADTTFLPAWRLERQLGIKTGFAQFTPAKRPQLAQRAPQVMSLAKRLVAILLQYPQWSKALWRFIGKSLETATEADIRLLKEVVLLLHQTQDASSAINWMSQAGFAEELDYIQKITLPIDEEQMKMLFSDTVRSFIEQEKKKQRYRKVNSELG